MIVNKISYLLKDNPLVKNFFKRLVQVFFSFFSIKHLKPINSILINQSDGEYFFGYYDKSPLNKNETYILTHFLSSSIKKKKPLFCDITIRVMSYKNTKKFFFETQSKAWNFQQGTMLQWLGPNFDSLFIFNDFQEGKLISKIVNVISKEIVQLSFPIYTISRCGSYSISTDFKRITKYNSVYGYKFQNLVINNYDVIYYFDLKANIYKPLINSNDLIESQSFYISNIRFEHMLLNNDFGDDKFIYFLRYKKHNKSFTSLYYFNLVTSKNYFLFESDIISHCNWIDKTTIIVFCKKNGIIGYYSVDLLNLKFFFLDYMPKIDGHPLYLSNKKYFITDTYPDIRRNQCLFSIDPISKKKVLLEKLFVPFEYMDLTRCDFHPKKNFTEEKIFIDAVVNDRRTILELKI